MNENVKGYLEFFGTTALFLVGIIFASTYLGIIVQKIGFVQSFDKYFYNLLANGYHTGLLDIITAPISNNFLPKVLGQVPSFIYVSAFLLFGFMTIWHRDKLVVSISSYLLAIAVAAGSLWMSTRYVNRSRPFLILANRVPIGLQKVLIGYTSWPSGHVRDIAILATIIGYFLPKTRWYMVALVVFVGLSRLYIGAHYPTDVVGGALIGFLIGAFAIYIVEFVKRKFDEKKK